MIDRLIDEVNKRNNGQQDCINELLSDESALLFCSIKCGDEEMCESILNALPNDVNPNVQGEMSGKTPVLSALDYGIQDLAKERERIRISEDDSLSPFEKSLALCRMGPKPDDFQIGKKRLRIAKSILNSIPSGQDPNPSCRTGWNALGLINSFVNSQIDFGDQETLDLIQENIDLIQNKISAMEE